MTRLEIVADTVNVEVKTISENENNYWLAISSMKECAILFGKWLLENGWAWGTIGDKTMYHQRLKNKYKTMDELFKMWEAEQ